MRRTTPVLCLAGIAATGWPASVASAALVGAAVSGQAVWVAAPENAGVNQYVHAEEVRVWAERRDVALAADLLADTTVSGLYDSEASLTPGVIAAGTYVRSYYIHFDSPGDDLALATGSVRFREEILGVFVLGDGLEGLPSSLDASDVLGAPGTIYPEQEWYRGLEFDSDSFTISESMRRVSFDLRITYPGDYMRVVTAGIPAPGAGLLLAGAGVLAGRRRR